MKVIVSLDNDEKEIREYNVSDLKFKARRKFNGNDKINDKELKALEELEKKEGNSHINDD